MGSGAAGGAARAGGRGAALARLILDTTILVEAERGESDLAEVISDGDDVAIAAITAAELLVGVELAGERHRSARSDLVERVLSTIPLEPYDESTARAHASLMAGSRRSGHPRGAHDLIIAATAVASGRTVLTADIAGFAGLPGVLVIEPPRTRPAPGTRAPAEDTTQP